jgi:DNA polymerase III subunit alpha
MTPTTFIHLRNHTEYSICSGAIKLKKIVAKTKEFGMPAVAISDSGNMFGALEYSCAASSEGIQPIIGVEFLIEAKDYFDVEEGDPYGEKNFCKIILIAQTDEGYYNLVSLASDNFLKRKGNIEPHIYFEWLKDKSSGIICLTGGYEGLIGKLLLKRKPELAEKMLLELKEIYGDRLYVELLRHGIKEESETEKGFIDLAYKYNIPLVATNDCYFLNKNMFKAQDVLSCIATGRYITENDRKRQTEEHYFKSPEEMIELFADIPEAIENTIVIAKRISTMAYKRKPTLPHFQLPEGVTEAQAIREITAKGLDERLKQKYINEKITDEEEKKKIREQYFKQLEYELEIIIKMDFSGYFLIVSDFIVWSKTHDVPVGPGRGSGAGSVVAWSMKITDVDPIKFDLFFERFLNPERISMPDFDVDFCQRGRERSIKYVQEKYGYDMVAQIITFGKLQSKMVIKDVGRVLQMSYGEVDKISKMIPMNATLEEALEQDEDLRRQQQTNPQIGELISIALELEGLNRHSSVHAAGVVIGDKPLQQICALYSDGVENSMPVVQYTMKYAENVGLVKFDFLGLKTLTIIKDALDFIKERDIIIDIDNIPLDDEGPYKMLTEGDSLGVFQVESTGMRSILKQLKPDKITDLTALVALYRPGPMESIPTYIKRKHELEKIECVVPKMINTLKDTYGVIVYQDQVMNLAKDLAGYTLGGADILRKAMGKKIKEEMDKQRDTFVEGSKKYSDIDTESANKIFDLMAKFASYGFNKAHATAYGIISYQTAYLKYYYPVEYIIASTNMDIADTDKTNFYLADLKIHGIKILPPDINKSKALFSVERIAKDNTPPSKDAIYKNAKKYHENKELAVRYGFSGIKGIGENVGEEIFAERKKNGDFKTIFDFVERMNGKVINKKTMEALAKAGAFDNIHPNRKQVHDSCEVLSKYCVSFNEEKNSAQLSLFSGMGISNNIKPVLARTDDWIGVEKHQKEFEAFGFYLRGHPLDTLNAELDERGITYSNELDTNSIVDGDKIRVAGVVISTKIKSSDKGRYAFIGISDAKSMIEVALFNNDLIIAHKDWLDDKDHKQLEFDCMVKKDDGGFRVIANDFQLLQDFIKNTKPNTLQKITHKQLKREFNSERKSWQQNTNNEFYKKKEEKKIVDDPILAQKIAKQNKIIEKLDIYIKNQSPLKDLSKIINISKKENIETWTKIILHITGGEKEILIDLGDGYQIFPLEKNRITKTNGVDKVE